MTGLPYRLQRTMDAKTTIRQATDKVQAFRVRATREPELLAAVLSIKRLQAQRFSRTYADLLKADSPFSDVANFFLTELYGDKDFSVRDAQFARIAGALERLFPPQVAQTAISLAQLHCLTEELDLAMAERWLVISTSPLSEWQRYVIAWREVGRRDARLQQLESTLHVGRELDLLTRHPGLRMMLRMMRGPAQMLGLSALQNFLENGFDQFASLHRQASGAESFLAMIKTRENNAINTLYDGDLKSMSV
jgi:hypothetical protein